jgi:hypothetical protein
MLVDVARLVSPDQARAELGSLPGELGVPSARPLVAAVEAWFGPASVAMGWPLQGRVLLQVIDRVDVAAAGRVAVAAAPVRLLVGRSLVADVVFAEVPVMPVRATTGRSLRSLERLAAAGAVVAADAFTAHLLALVAGGSANGCQLRVDAVKAAAWAASEVLRWPELPQVF